MRGFTSVLLPLYENSVIIFLINLLLRILFPCSFEQEELSSEIQHISAFLQSLTDDSTTTDDAGVNKQASPHAAGSND